MDVHGFLIFLDLDFGKGVDFFLIFVSVTD